MQSLREAKSSQEILLQIYPAYYFLYSLGTTLLHLSRSAPMPLRRGHRTKPLSKVCMVKHRTQTYIIYWVWIIGFNDQILLSQYICEKSPVRVVSELARRYMAEPSMGPPQIRWVAQQIWSQICTTVFWSVITQHPTTQEQDTHTHTHNTRITQHEFTQDTRIRHAWQHNSTSTPTTQSLWQDWRSWRAPLRNMQRRFKGACQWNTSSNWWTMPRWNFHVNVQVDQCKTHLCRRWTRCHL